MTPTEYVQLCKELRELGATSVEADGYKATFPTAVRVVVPETKTPETKFLPPPVVSSEARSPDDAKSAVEIARARRAKEAEGLFG